MKSPTSPGNSKIRVGAANALLQGLPGISAVERDTGISKDLLRAWERRYGFPAPLRDLSGERVYPAEQVQRLRLLKRLLDAGHRPGRVVAASHEALEALLRVQTSARQVAETGASLLKEQARCIEMLIAHDVDGLRRLLSQAMLRMGLGPCLLELIAPLTGLIGEKWLNGELAIFEEHIYTESLQQLLRQALQSIPRDALAERPRVVLTTLPGEQHGLGLLMVETMLALAGCQCLSLGVQTPLDELIRAANSHKADIVALSFTGILSTGMVQRSLGELRAQLPPGVALWAGGSSQALQRGSGLDGVRRVTALSAIAGEVSRWRAAQA